MVTYRYLNANTSNTDPEMEVTCPFDKNHQMPARTFAHHIKTCPMRDDQDYKLCMYNARHIVDAREYQEHLQHCPDKVYFEKSDSEDEFLIPITRDNDKTANIPILQGEEDWDLESSGVAECTVINDHQQKPKSLNEMLHSLSDEWVKAIIDKTISKNGLIINIRGSLKCVLSRRLFVSD
uniref:Gametocyte-specific factor 1-like (Trinotate prediction) n=1 Tax=Myxobolus squamalis TaxID=59785 RepID=A0A6B2G2J5_MYXSQ